VRDGYIFDTVILGFHTVVQFCCKNLILGFMAMRSITNIE